MQFILLRTQALNSSSLQAATGYQIQIKLGA